MGSPHVESQKLGWFRQGAFLRPVLSHITWRRPQPRAQLTSYSATHITGRVAPNCMTGSSENRHEPTSQLRGADGFISPAAPSAPAPASTFLVAGGRTPRLRRGF